MIPVVLSGGSGTRLWPVSRTKYPKQFNQLFDETLQTMTLKRLSQLGAPVIVTSKTLRDFTEKKAQEAGIKNVQVIYEPQPLNTAPAIAVLCRVLELQGKAQEVVGVFPADHLIGNETEFLSAVSLAEQSASRGKVVTLGLKPDRPETGYGYIQIATKPVSFNQKLSSFEVIRFHEKPALEVAQKFLAAGTYFWNAGIFIAPVYVLIEHFKRFQPQIWAGVSLLKPDLSNIAEIYENLPSVSIDYAIMEKLGEGELLCVPCNPEWSDVGSWDAVADVYESTGRGSPDSIQVDSKNNFLIPQGDKKYAFVGAEDLIVVDTQDALLIVKRGHSQDVKTVVDRLKAQKSTLVHEHPFEERPWGRFDVLSEDFANFKSKVIRVNPGAQLSYQSHTKREEHWIIVAGEGIVVLNEKEIPVRKGSYVHIPVGAKHRLRNSGTVELEMVEVQLGSYFGEDDITRYQDDYKRV
jgi:mannose-1-phosphate guanylyltransferase/mannose-1-phosphate guanylyltransferase/mannose-6-phosphate isomerase